MKSSKGFTLIELLVVLSIIGFLSSVVIAALNDARNKAADVTVKAVMKSLRNQGPIFRDTNANFNASLGAIANCTTASTFFMDSQVQKIRANLATYLPASATIACSTDAGGFKWSLSVSALKGAGTSWCIDNNTGWFKAGTASVGTCS